MPKLPGPGEGQDLGPAPGWFGPDPVYQVVDDVGPVGVADLEDTVDVDGGWLGRVAGGDQLEAGGEHVGPRRRPVLPGLHDVDGLVQVPGEVEVDSGRRGNCAEDERRHHAEAGGAGPTQRPEEIRLSPLVARDDAAVGQHKIWAETIRSDVSP